MAQAAYEGMKETREQFRIVHKPNGRFLVETPDGSRLTVLGHYDGPLEFWWNNEHYIALTQYYGEAIVMKCQEQPTTEVDETT